jgi:membrane protein involved in colicin uptake
VFGSLQLTPVWAEDTSEEEEILLTAGDPNDPEEDEIDGMIEDARQAMEAAEKEKNDAASAAEDAKKAEETAKKAAEEAAKVTSNAESAKEDEGQFENYHKGHDQDAPGEEQLIFERRPC